MTLDLWGDLSDPKKARILQAALKVFAEKGYAEATTRAIAAQAGMANGLLFYHYKDKENLFLELAKHLRKAVVEQLSKMVSGHGDFYERLAFLVEQKLGLCACYPEVFQFFLIQLRQFPDQYRKQGREIRSLTSLRQELWDDGTQSHRILLSALDGLVADLIERFYAGAITAEQLMERGCAGAEEYIGFFRKLEQA